MHCSVHVGFMVNKAALEQVFFFQVFRVSVVSIIPLVPHEHLFIHHQSLTMAAIVSTGKMPPSSYPSKDCSPYNIFLHPRLRSLYRSLTSWLPHLKCTGFLYSLQHMVFSQPSISCYIHLRDDTVYTVICLT